MATFFDESYYLKTKLAQLKSKGEKDADGNDYTLTTLQKAIADAGMTPETHYQLHGRTEQLNPNAYFNEAEYLIAKTNQVNSIAQDGRSNWTVEEVKAAIAGLNMSVAEHYEAFGGHETDAKGNLINPSNAFDANAYVVAKLAELVKTEPEKWAGKTASDVIAAIAENGMSPVTHYEMHGATEANAYGVPLVQTVPVTQRVENDPARAEVTGENVPSNYNAPTPPPAEVTADKAAPVTKPADVGGLTNATVSPEVTAPSEPIPVPGDADYVAPPANIVDTNDKPVVVVPPAKPGDKPQFGVVGDNGTINGVDSNGKPTDTIIGNVDNSGTINPTDPEPEPTPNPDPVDPTPPPAPTFSVTNSNGVLSFSHDNGTIEFSLSGTTATFKSGDVTKTVSNFDTESISLTENQILKADVAALNAHTVTGGKVQTKLAETTATTDFSSDIIIDENANNNWHVDRAKPASFVAKDGTLQQTINGPNSGLANNFYGTQGYKHSLPEGTTSISIELDVPDAWVTTGAVNDVSSGKTTRWAGFWGVANDNNDDISAYPIIEFATRAGKTGFYGYNTETGEWTGFVEAGSGNHTLNIQTNANGTFTYSVDGNAFYTTPTTDTKFDGDVPSATLSEVILQGYSYKSDDATYTSVNESYTIQWDNLATTTVTPVEQDLDLSGIANLAIKTPIHMGNGKVLTINAEQANSVVVDGTVHIDASASATGVTVDAVEWAGSTKDWSNAKGFTDGQLTSVTGSDHDDFFSLDMADIGTLTDNGTTVTFNAATDLKLDGGAGDHDTLKLTWFGPTGSTTHTLAQLNANSFGDLSGFETLVLNKGNSTNSLNIDASWFTGKGVGTLQLMTSANITGIDDTLTIGFTEGNLTSLAALDLTADNKGTDILNLKVMDSGVGKGGFVALTAKDFETIKLTGSSASYVETIATNTYQSATEVKQFTELGTSGTINTVTLVTANNTTYIVATGADQNSNTDDWVVQLAGVKSTNLSVDGKIVTVDLSAEA